MIEPDRPAGAFTSSPRTQVHASHYRRCRWGNAAVSSLRTERIAVGEHACHRAERASAPADTAQAAARPASRVLGKAATMVTVVRATHKRSSTARSSVVAPVASSRGCSRSGPILTTLELSIGIAAALKGARDEELAVHRLEVDSTTLQAVGIVRSLEARCSASPAGRC